MHDALALLGIQMAPLAAQPLDRAGAAVLRRRLGVPLAHAVGLCAARRGPQSRGRASMPASTSGRVTILAMCLSGALAGFVGVNEIMGVHHRLDARLPGRLRLRRHRRGADGPQPSGRHRAGGAAVRRAASRAAPSSPSRFPTITREMVVVIQGLVILFSGALENMSAAAGCSALFARAVAPALDDADERCLLRPADARARPCASRRR